MRDVGAADRPTMHQRRRMHGRRVGQMYGRQYRHDCRYYEKRDDELSATKAARRMAESASAYLATAMPDIGQSSRFRHESRRPFAYSSNTIRFRVEKARQQKERQEAEHDSRVARAASALAARPRWSRCTPKKAFGRRFLVSNSASAREAA